MPTTLAAGDLAIIGINADNPDSFNFVLLTDIDTGTEIFFTDEGVLSDGSLRTSEGTVKYTAPTAISAGTVIQFTGIGGDFTLEDSGFALSTGGDQVIAYQGTAATPTFIYAAQTNSTQFQTGSNSTLQSDLPPGLTVGTSAVAVGFGPGVQDEFDNSTYNEALTNGTQAELLAAISNATNWTGNNIGPITLADGPFTVNGATPVNEAPVLSGNVIFTAINEDVVDTANLGNTVAELGSLITDANFDPEGIAITSVDNTNGTWQYSTDGGSSWQNLDASVSDSNAVTLGARSLYTNALGTQPNSQGDLSFTNLNLVTPTTVATETTDSSGTTLDTTADQNIYSGYSNYFGPSTVSPDFPTLDNTVGYEISFTMQLLEESRTNQSRAGFSIIAISQDTTKAIELGFQKTSATTGNIFAQGGPTFVAAENVSFNTTEFTNYTLGIQGDAYTLSADGIPILTGALRDYTSFVGAIDPYETPNFIFLGDDTTSAQGSFSLSQIAVETETRIRFAPNTDYNGDATLQFRAWDTTDGSDNGDTGIDTSTNGNDTAFSNTVSTGTVTVNAVNDQPSFTASNPASVDIGSGAVTLNNWAAFNPGGGETTQTATYLVSNISNPAIFTTTPSIDTNGNLTYTPSASVAGSSTFTVQVQDDGGTSNGGIDTSTAQTFTITVQDSNSSGSGNTVIPVTLGESLTPSDFVGVGRDDNPSEEIRNNADTLAFSGQGLTASNLLLTQQGNDLLVSFAVANSPEVLIANLSLEDLDNLTLANGVLGNIQFEGQTAPSDNYDVFAADAMPEVVAQENTVTFLNDLNNFILGRDSGDVINGQGGDDGLYGRPGNDILRGGDGNDTIGGGKGNDFLDGGNGNDTLEGKVDDDQLFGGDGNDLLDGGTGNDGLSGQLGNDQLFGRDGNDTLNGNSGDDTLYGNFGSDQLFGEAGNDFLSGGRDADVLNGGEGDDLLSGGFKSDILTGGAGSDTFRYLLLKQSLLEEDLASAFDIITDLAIGTDIIDSVTAVSASNVIQAGNAAALNEASIQAVLTTASFTANGGATFTVASRTFLALNDNVAGYQQSNDALIEITGYTGDLTNLAIT